MASFADVWNSCAPDTELWSIVIGIRPIYERLIHTMPGNTRACYSVTPAAGLQVITSLMRRAARDKHGGVASSQEYNSKEIGSTHLLNTADKTTI